MYCLRLFITRITLFTTMFTVIIVVCSLKRMCIPSFVLIGYYVYGPYRNVWPEAIYCCFTRTIHCLTKLLTSFV